MPETNESLEQRLPECDGAEKGRFDYCAGCNLRGDYRRSGITLFCDYYHDVFLKQKDKSQQKEDTSSTKPTVRLDKSNKIDSETAAFADYSESYDKEEPGPQAMEVSESMSMEEWERMEAAKNRRLSALLEKQREKDQEMFGFGKFGR